MPRSWRWPEVDVQEFDGREVVSGRQFVGYVYQVDTTILRWLQLQMDEALELACGEDIDLLGPSIADPNTIPLVKIPVLSPGSQAGPDPSDPDS